MLGWGMTSANDSSFWAHGPGADVSGESSNEVSYPSVMVASS
jgi:hypothetical protein